MNEDSINKKILEALEDNKYKWRTPKGIAKQIGVSESDVLEVISNNLKNDVVKSSVPSQDGSPLFTTRDHFSETSSVLDKLVGAFKGRIR